MLAQRYADPLLHASHHPKFNHVYCFGCPSEGSSVYSEDLADTFWKHNAHSELWEILLAKGLDIVPLTHLWRLSGPRLSSAFHLVLEESQPCMMAWVVPFQDSPPVWYWIGPSGSEATCYLLGAWSGLGESSEKWHNRLKVSLILAKTLERSVLLT